MVRTMQFLSLDAALELMDCEAEKAKAVAQSTLETTHSLVAAVSRGTHGVRQLKRSISGSFRAVLPSAQPAGNPSEPVSAVVKVGTDYQDG